MTLCNATSRGTLNVFLSLLTSASYQKNFRRQIWLRSLFLFCNLSWENGCTLPQIAINLPIWSFSVKEKHISSAISKILRYRQTNKQTEILLLYYKDIHWMDLSWVEHKVPNSILNWNSRILYGRLTNDWSVKQWIPDIEWIWRKYAQEFFYSSSFTNIYNICIQGSKGIRRWPINNVPL